MAIIELMTSTGIASPPANGALWNLSIQKLAQALGILTLQWYSTLTCTSSEATMVITEMICTNTVSPQTNGTRSEGMECGLRVDIALQPLFWDNECTSLAVMMAQDNLMIFTFSTLSTRHGL